MGATSIIDPVKKFSIPFLVLANFCFVAIDPDVLCIEPSVKNLNNGPLDLVIAVRIGAIVSPDCLIVGEVTNC